MDPVLFRVTEVQPFDSSDTIEFLHRCIAGEGGLEVHLDLLVRT